MSHTSLLIQDDVDSIVSNDKYNGVPEAEHRIDYERCSRKLRIAISELEPLVRKVAQMRYGFSIDSIPLTVKEVSFELGLFPDQVSEIEKVALKQIVERIGLERLVDIMQVMIEENS